MRSFYRSVPPLEIVELERIVEPVPEVTPIDIAAIAVVEPVIEPASIDVIEASIKVPVETITETISDVHMTVEPVEAPIPPPALEIISLERVDRSKLPAKHSPRSWRYSISRWAYRWWLWTREAFRQCFPTS